MTAKAANWWSWRSRPLWRAAGGIAAAGLLALIVLLVAHSRLPRRAAGIYGGLFERIQQHPEATAAICLGGVTLLWGGIGVLAWAQGDTTKSNREP